MEKIDQNLLFLHLSSYASCKDIEVVRMLSQYSMGEHHAVLFPEPKLKGGGGRGAKHVRLDGPEHVVSSNIDLMKILNGYSTDTTSTYLGQLDRVRFSLNHLPTKQWYGPKGWAYFDFFLNDDEYARLEEGREEYESIGLRFALVVSERGFFCSFFLYSST